MERREASVKLVVPLVQRPSILPPPTFSRLLHHHHHQETKEEEKEEEEEQQQQQQEEQPRFRLLPLRFIPEIPFVAAVAMDQ